MMKEDGIRYQVRRMQVVVGRGKGEGVRGNG
jgi:hypothetical protein